jgi:CRP/FNR family transcriptional regulator
MTSDCTLCPVRSASFCNAISDRNLKALTKRRRVIESRRHQTLFIEGEKATSFFSVVSGMVKLCRSLPDGRTQIVGFRRPGEFFGAVVGDKYTTSAEAITSTTVCCFSRSDLTQQLEASPRLQTRLLDMGLKQLSDAQGLVLILGRMTAREKVASFLTIYCCCSFHDGTKPLRWAKLSMSRSEIGDFLGLTIETVSRVLTSLASEEIIAIGRRSHSIQIVNPDALARAAADCKGTNYIAISGDTK